MFLPEIIVDKTWLSGLNKNSNSNWIGRKSVVMADQ
jgi:hypothetical protein